MKQLVKRAMNHDNTAFVELIQGQTQAMYKVARGILKNDEDIADALQETILKCYEKIDTLKEPKYFKTWMTRILINNCNDILRASKLECSYEEYVPVAVSDDNTSYYEFVQLIDSLDEKYRMIILLYYVWGFKIKEIGEILNIKESTIKTRLNRGREKLRLAYGRSETKSSSGRFMEVEKYAK